MTGEWTRRRLLGSAAVAGAGVLAGCRTASAAGIGVDRETAVVDRPLDVRLGGLPEAETVTVTATTTGYWPGETWRSRATFETDSEGRVALAAQAPTEGSYDGRDAMGLFWSLAPVDDAGTDAATPTDSPTPTLADEETPTPTPTFGERIPDGYEVRLEASVDDSVEATTTVTRRWRGADVETVPVEASDLVGTAFLPPGEGPHPGVLVLHGSGGVREWATAGLLASHGYAALAVDYFGLAEGNPSSLHEVPLSYFERAKSWLTARDDVRDGEVGLVGGSRGGEAVLLLGATFDWPAVVVGYVPSVYVWGGLGGGAAWTRDGEPLPYLLGSGAASRTDDGATVARQTFVDGVEEASERRREAAAIPVEDTDAPVLLISGEDDQLWPSTMFCRHAVERLEAAGFDHDYEHLAYEDAGHAIRPPYQPTTKRQRATVTGTELALGGTPAGYARADADHWPVVLKYLEKGLR